MKHLFEITKVLDNADSPYVALLDFGHGDNTPGKRSPVWEDGTQLLEWEFNRKVGKQLVNMLIEARLNFFVVSPESNDIPLATRVKRANDFARAHKNFKTMFISLHGNADPSGKGHGIEVWTSVGQTKSDLIADIYMEKVKRYMPDWATRRDFSDGDADKEAHFYVLKHTSMPAILPEMGFYSNEEECKRMMDINVQHQFAKVIHRTITSTIKADIL